MRIVVLAALLALAAPATAAAPRIVAPQDVDPVWSPDGTRIAFTRVSGSQFALAVVDLATHRVRQLATNRYKLAPSWSPDGRSIAYQANGAIWQVDARPYGGRGFRLTGRGQRAFAPVWAVHDPEVIAYLTTLGARNTDLWTMDLTADGIERELVARDVIGVPAWSRDGRLAFQRDDGIYVVENGVERRVAQVANPGPPAWSPDSARLAFAADGRIWVADLAGSTAPVTERVAGLGQPVWTGRTTLIAVRRGGLLPVGLAHEDFAALDLPTREGGSISYAPAAQAVAVSAARTACPGHYGILVVTPFFRKTPVTGSCVIAGTARADSIDGTPQRGDVIHAGAGNDVVRSNDRLRDTVDCGPGRDTVFADRSDRLHGCEGIRR